MTNVSMPQLGETVAEGTVTKWFKQVGDSVVKGEPLFEVSTDKVDTEIPAPVAGVLTAIFVIEGVTVDVGTLLATIGLNDGSEDRASRAAASSASPSVSTPHTSSSQSPSRTESDDRSSKLSPAVRRLLEEHKLTP
ncbi:MAG TPA: biotin/lipoyl-containing protein, partial [Acidimicrobiales bacterium]|nr:biotin/lipoyl-containing protein [Acidimicrobiales bacterium]